MKKIIMIILAAFLLVGCSKDDDGTTPQKEIETVDLNKSLTDVNLSELVKERNQFIITYNLDGNKSRTDTYHPNGIVSTTVDTNTTTATPTVTGTTVNHDSSTTDHSMDTDNGKIEVGATYTHQTTPTTTTTAVVQQITTGVTRKSTLMAMGLDSSDADYLIAHHSADVDVVINKKDRIFKDLHLDVSMFVDSSDASSTLFDSGQAGGSNVTWSPSEITAFKKMFGRFAFVINSPKFISSFNSNIGLLNSAYEGNTQDPNFPSIPYPKTYTEFKNAANSALATNGNHYKFFVTTRSKGVAYGITYLKLQMEQEMFTTASNVHNTEGLILHEMTHSWGYAHAYNDARTTLKSNNIPYYVQFIIAYDADNPASVETSGVVAGTPKALNTIYFGN